MSKKHSLAQLVPRLKDHYRGQKVAVAGGAGFVGYQLVKILSVLVGEDGMVMVLDDFSRGDNVVTLPNVYYICSYDFPVHKTDYHFVRGKDLNGLLGMKYYGIDVARPDTYFDMIEDVTTFFNLAAVVAGVLHNQNHHLQMYMGNVRVLAGPLQACERAGVPNFFQTSSVCVYSPARQSPCDEGEGWGGAPHPANAGYAEAKRDGERMTWWSDLERIVIGRPSNIIGPYDYYDELAHVVPAFIKRAISTTGTFDAYGSSQIQREFIYSWDVALGMATAMAFGENRESYNIGTGGDSQITMLSLASKIIQLARHHHVSAERERRILFHNEKGGGDERRFSNADKLRGLGWAHTVDLNEALDLTMREFISRGGDWGEPDYLSDYV